MTALLKSLFELEEASTHKNVMTHAGNVNLFLVILIFELFTPK